MQRTHFNTLTAGTLEGKKVHHDTLIYSIYFIAFLVGLFNALPAYVNSSFLSSLGSAFSVNAYYTLSSIASIIGFIIVFPLVRKYGNYNLAKSLLYLLVITLVGMAYFKSIYLVGPLFVIMTMLMNLLVFSTDVFLEVKTTRESTGRIRGTYLTIINFAWIVSPSLASSLILNGDFWRVYVASAIILFPIIYIISRNFKAFKDPVYPKVSMPHALKSFIKQKDLTLLSIANIILNVFYIWMMIYTPIYLIKDIGFQWTEVGFIFTFMLIPFVLVELPFGKIADNGLGEKEIMIAGAFVMAISTSLLYTLTDSNIVLWALILFMTRIGAAMMEIMIETYFFKKIHHRDTNLLSIFRMTRPLAYLIGPLLFGITSIFFDMRTSFIVLGIICIFSVPFILGIKDTN